MKSFYPAILKVVLLVVTLTSHLLYAAEGDTLWTKTFGGANIDEAKEVIETSAGTLLLAGYTLSSGSGSGDIYLVATDLAGNLLWTQTYGESGMDQANSVIETSDGEYLLAGTTSVGGVLRMTLLKVEASNQAQLWSRTFGNASSGSGWSVIETSDDYYLLAGNQNYTSANTDMYLVKVSVDGDSTLWSHSYGGLYQEGARRVIEVSTGGYLVAGWTEYSLAGFEDVYLVRVGEEGDTLWTAASGSPSENERAYSVIETSDGYFLAAGLRSLYTLSDFDMYLVKFNQAGEVLWSRIYGGAANDEAYSVIETSDGNYLVAGFTFSEGAGAVDAYFVKVDTSGMVIQWATTCGGSIDEKANSVIQTSTGDYIAAGWTNTFGAGNNSVYLLCLEGLPSAAPALPVSPPGDFILPPVHPNPFNASTVIRYQIPDARQVNLRVYDTVGRLVKILVNGWREAGEHSATFDASELPSGIYLIHLQAGEQVEVRKAVLLK